jgi:hypothetical protein
MALQRVEDCYPTDELVEELTGGGVLLVGAFGSSLRNVVNQAAYTATGGTDSAPLESLNVVSLHSTLCSRLFRQRRSARSACGIPIAVLWAETKQTSFGSRPCCSERKPRQHRAYSRAGCLIWPQGWLCCRRKAWQTQWRSRVNHAPPMGQSADRAFTSLALGLQRPRPHASAIGST